VAQDLRGKTALITGAAKRIGRETALALAKEGCSVAVHYRSSVDEARELVAQLEAKGVSAWAVKADFEKLEDVETLIKRTLEMSGGLDILVNNASIFPQNTLDSMTFHDVALNMHVNAWVPFALSRDFAREIGRGKIVNLLDSRIEDYDWSHTAYMISKHALAAFTNMTALAYAPEIAVNAVAPGLILPPPGKDIGYIEAMRDTLPLRKHGDPRDVADAVVYLAKSEFLTGEVIFVDGGRHLREYPGDK